MKDFVVTIGGYKWSVVFVPKEEIMGYDGKTYANEFKIVIRNDLQPITARLVFIHEVIHALFDTQGRYSQRKFDVEEVCEFIAFRLAEINALVKTFDEIAFNDDPKLEPSHIALFAEEKENE